MRKARPSSKNPTAPITIKYDRRKDEPEQKFEIGFKEGSPRYVESPTGQGVAFDGKLYFDAGIRRRFPLQINLERLPRTVHDRRVGLS